MAHCLPGRKQTLNRKNKLLNKGPKWTQTQKLADQNNIIVTITVFCMFTKLNRRKIS